MGEFIVIEPDQHTAVGAPLDVILEGGPADLPSDLRTHRVRTGQTKVKLRHRGGYEHFERDGNGAFRWTGRTRVAE